MPERPENTIVGHIKNGFLARMMNYSPPAVVTWLALVNRADSSGRCHPSISTIQNDTGLSRATVYRTIDQLVQAGEIDVVPGKGKGNPTNEYHISGSLTNELVQTRDQFNRETKVVQTRDKGGLRIEHKPNVLTKRDNQTVRAPSKKFIKPSIDDVRSYCQERKNAVDAQHFLDYYEANGWRVGRNAMKDWRAAVRTWERNGFSTDAAKKPTEPIKYRNR